MTSEQAIAYIAAALVHLEEFSLPKVGTFKKVYLPAKIVPQKKIIIPPITKFELEKEERKTELFVRFLMNEYGLREQEAREITNELGNFVSSYVSSVGSLEIPGIGSIVKAGKYFRFKNYVSSEGLMMEPVSFKTIQVSGREIKNKSKGKSGQASKLKKIGIFAGITLGTLIVFSSLLYGILYKHFYPVFGIKVGFLHKLHKMDEPKKVKKKAKLFAAAEETTDSTATASDSSATDSSEVSTTSTEEKIIEDVQTSAKTDQAGAKQVPEPVQETPVTPASIFDNVIDPATISGPRYFVIVASSNDKQKVESTYKKFKAQGFSPKLLKHPKMAGWYRVAMSEYPDKASANQGRKKAKALGVNDAWVWTVK